MKNTMKKVAFMAATMILVAMTLSLTGCKGDENTLTSKDRAVADAKVEQHHVAPIEGTYGDALIALKCKNVAVVTLSGAEEATEIEYQSWSIYRINGGNVAANVEGIDGCHKVTASGAIEGTNLTITHVYDTVMGGVRASFPGYPGQLDFTTRITPCHLTLDTVCFNSNDRILEGKGHDELLQPAHAQGEWYGLITIHDTNWQVVYIHDTVVEYIHDTVHATVTDTMIVSGDTTTYTKYYINKHIADLGVVNGKVGGRDSLIVVTFKNGQFYSRNGWVYEHWTPRVMTGFNTPFAVEDDGACTEIINGNGTEFSHAISVICGTTTITGLPSDVVMFADPCEAHAYRSCINGTTAVVRYAWDNGVEAATENVAISYSGNTPDPDPFFPDADILDGYATRYYTGQNDVYGTIHYWMKVRRHSDNGIEWREADEATTITAASFSTVTSAFNASGASVSVSSVLSTIDADLAAGWVPTWVNGGANGVKMGVEKISNSGNTITVATVGQTEAYHVNLINGSINQDPNQPLVGHWNGSAMVSEDDGTVMFTAAN